MRKAVATGTIKDWSIGVTSSHEGVDLVVNNTHILTALRDSGAQNSVMSDQLARGIGLNIRPSDETYRGVSSGKQQVAGIATINFTFAALTEPVLTIDVRIVPENSYLFLLGGDVFGNVPGHSLLQIEHLG